MADNALRDLALRVLDLAVYKKGPFEHLEALADEYMASPAGQDCIRLSKIATQDHGIAICVEEFIRQVFIQGFLTGGTAQLDHVKRYGH